MIDAGAGGPYYIGMSTQLSPALGLREARLRPEAAARCPWATADVWLPASTLADKALKNTLKNTGHDVSAAPAGRRALPEDAFEFRGGRPELRLRAGARTRWSDHPRRWTGGRR
jgi:hypothetical protein